MLYTSNNDVLPISRKLTYLRKVNCLRA